MTTPPPSDRPTDTRFDPPYGLDAAHAHSRRCYWDLHRGGWQCPPPERESTGGDGTTATRDGM